VGFRYSREAVYADYSLSLRPRPSVRGVEPHPTRGDPVIENTADLKE